MTFTVRKVGAEWCAFHPGGREVARSHTKELLQGYIDSLNTVGDHIARISGTTEAEATSTAAAVVAAYTEEAAVTLDKITYRTRARSTGAMTASGRSGKGWGAMCVSHGHVVSAEGGTAAEKMTSKPQEWCPTCAEIAGGGLPKLPKPSAELEELL